MLAINPMIGHGQPRLCVMFGVPTLTSPKEPVLSRESLSPTWTTCRCRSFGPYGGVVLNSRIADDESPLMVEQRYWLSWAHNLESLPLHLFEA